MVINTPISPLVCKIFVAEQWAYTLKKWRAQEDWGPSPGGPRKPFQKRFLHEQKELLCGIDGYWQFKVRLRDAVTFCLFSVSKSMFDCIAVHWMSMGVELPSFHSDPPEGDLKLSSIQWTSMILSFNRALQNFRYFITRLSWWIPAALSCNVNLTYCKQDRSDTVSLHPALEVDDQSDIDQSFLGCVVSALNLKWFTDPIFLLMIASKYHTEKKGSNE